MLRRLRYWFNDILLLLIGIIVLTQSEMTLSDPTERVRAFTRNIEFDYVNWTLDALFSKNQFAALQPQDYISPEDGREIIGEYFHQIDLINTLQAQIANIYSDPSILDPDAEAQDLNVRLKQMQNSNDRLASLSEAILQQQVSRAVVDLDLSLGGQLIPPLLYHVTPLPLALIVSPRDFIREEADISLQAGIPINQIIHLEDQIDEKLDVSSLVVNVGGVGIYPTMVLRTTDLAWLIETIAHEWTHNYLTLRPLGLLYTETPEMRTMNETTANLAGKEIALIVYQYYYPQFIPQETEPNTSPPAQPETPVFDFRAEMHETRITVDKMLSDGKIDEAEAYMEERRIFFWENGYHIRKLNQAYFAFYGAYADVPGGSAGTDPVGPAVVALREQSSSLAEFLNRISWMTSYDELVRVLSK